VANLLELDFDLKLFSCIISQLRNLLSVIVESEIKDLFKGKLGAFLIKLFFNFEFKLLPMTLTDSIISKISNQGHGCSELINLILKVLVDTPLSDLLVKALNLLLEFNSSVIHVINLQLFEGDFFPSIPLRIPLFFYTPDLKEL